MKMNKALRTASLAICLTAILFWAAGPAYPSSSDLLQYLPDGTGVFIVDFDKVTSSSLWSSAGTQKGIRETIEKIEPGLGDIVSPNDIRMIAVRVGGSDFENLVAVVTGSFNQSEVLTRLKANGKMKLTSEKYKNLDLYTASSATRAATSHDVSFTFYDSGTVIIGSAAGVRSAVDTKTSGKSSIAQNAKITGALSESQPGAIRFALTNASFPSGLASNELIPDFSTINLVFGTIDMASAVDFNATLRSDTGEHAKSIADRLNGLLSMTKGFLVGAANQKFAPVAEVLKTVNITTADADVKVSGNLSIELLNSLIGGAAKQDK